MLELSAKALLQNIEVEIFPVPDMGDNERRRNYISKNLPDFQYVMTGNARVQEIFKDTDKTIIPLEIRQFVKWATIRGQLATHNIQELENVLPHEVVEYLQKIKAPERLKEIFSKERKSPTSVVDIVLFDKDGKLILIERKNFPQWTALPGWCVDYGETGKSAAIRETKEEISLDIEIEKELGTWDDPNRDPRGHNVSRAFKGKIVGGILQAADDAKAIIKIDPKDLDTIIFAFPDHKEMILEALKTTS